MYKSSTVRKSRLAGVESSRKPDETFQSEPETTDGDVVLGAHAGGSGISRVLLEQAVQRALAQFPNDLSRLIHLASIRDNNTGTYLHPELSRCYDVEAVDDLLRSFHRQVFTTLIELPLQDYVSQLTLYIAASGVKKPDLIGTWKALEPYKVAIPLDCDEIAAEVFCVNMLAALSILQGPVVGK